MKEDHQAQERSKEELLTENERLRKVVAKQDKRIKELEKQLEEIKEKLEDAQRWQKRQAAPFSRGKAKPNPKKPGRRVGHKAAHREKPERVDRTIRVDIGRKDCPECSGELSTPIIQEQYQVDIPRVEPFVTKFEVEVAYCCKCGQRVQGRNEEQTSDALGAAAVQLGPNVLALAAEMKHRLGISYGKLRSFFWTTFHVLISRGGLARAGQRVAEKLKPTYEVLKIKLREKTAVNADETGWKIGGRSAWLWVFTQEEITVYVIDYSRGHGVVEDVLGEAFGGTLISDCFLAYEPLDYEKQKCLAHLLKRCAKIEELKSRGAVRFSRRVAGLLRGAIALKKRRASMSEHGYRVACGRIEAAMNRLLESNLTDPDNIKLANLLEKHRDSLFRFLYEETVEATNNRAERALRPAVIARKLSAGNRTDVGADTHATIASVAQTYYQQGRDFLAAVKDVLCNQNPMVLPLGSLVPSDA